MLFCKRTSFLLLSYLYWLQPCQYSSSSMNELLEGHSNLWAKFDNEVIEKIDSDLKNYYLNMSTVKEKLLDVIETDLKSFKNGITFEVIQNAAIYYAVTYSGTKYQLINHTLYRHKHCLFPTRCQGIEHFLLKLTNLNDYEIVINTRDYPQVPIYLNLQVPLFSFSKTNEFLDIMYPAWSFWCGGPAIKLFPTGIGRWDKMRTSLIDTAKKWPWKKKKSIAFFRGSRTSSQRDELIYLSRESPEIIDAAYTKNQAWKSREDTLNADPAPEVSFEEHCHFKFLFNFRGVAASFRFKHLFLCRSLVFHVGDEWQEFFYPVLKPWIHYIPISSDYNRGDIRNILKFFKEHDDLAQSIAENGYNFVKEQLTLGKVTWYWKRLLKKYIHLQKFKPLLDYTLTRVHDM